MRGGFPNVKTELTHDTETLNPHYSLSCRMSHPGNGFNCRGSWLRDGKSSLSQVKEKNRKTESFEKQDRSGIQLYIKTEAKI